MAARSKEPSSAPHAEEWYPLVLGSSLTDQPSKRFYSLRYEFKPASIDTSRPGTLHKSAENKVTVEFCNNQPGKANVAFQGVNEDCKDSEGVLFFDGKTLRLERLHRAVKTLRHLRLPGESSSAANHADARSSPLQANGHAAEESTVYRPLHHVEEIVVGSQHEPAGGASKKVVRNPKLNKSKTPTPSSSPLKRSSPSLLDIVDDDVVDVAKRPRTEHVDVYDDAGDGHESDYVLEDVDVSDEEDKQQLAPAPVAEPAKPESSTSSGSSSSSGSGSDSSSSDGSDEDSPSR